MSGKSLLRHEQALFQLDIHGICKHPIFFIFYHLQLICLSSKLKNHLQQKLLALQEELTQIARPLYLSPIWSFIDPTSSLLLILNQSLLLFPPKLGDSLIFHPRPTES